MRRPWLLLSIDGRHVGIALACREARRQRRVDALEIALRQLHVECLYVLLEMRAALAAGNRNDVAALRQHPSERELRRRHLLLARDLLNALHQVEVLLKIFRLEARVAAAPIVRLEIVERFDLARQKAAA